MNTPFDKAGMDKYPYNEYSLVLKPNASVNEKIQNIKEAFIKNYKISSAKYSDPNINLVTFVQFEEMEARLLNRLHTIALGYRSFKVDLKNYGSLPSHTIFINIESKQQIRNLVKELTQARALLTLNQQHKPHFLDDHHLTIARGLLPWQYEQGWKEYIHKDFSAHFFAESMLLLKRPVTVYPERYQVLGKYQLARQFSFMNLPIAIKQGNLFS